MRLFSPSPLLAGTVLALNLVACPAGAFDQAHSRYARLLKRYVSSEGVNYRGLKADPADLRAYLEEAAQVKEDDFKAWSRTEQLAFLINLYNAATLKLVVDHYPVASIRRIGGLFTSPWELEVVPLWGGVHSLDWLEHKVIRPRYSEPRVHFALVCAARGCPPLRTEPYLAARLDGQLDGQARTFLKQRNKNRLDAPTRTLYLSPIFDWYGDDFIAHAKTLPAFVLPYFSKADAALLADPKLRVVFTKYDWSLNEERKSK
jgi:Protein of unknown function, DUF547